MGVSTRLSPAGAVCKILGLPDEIREGERVLKLRRYIATGAGSVLVIDAEYQTTLGAQAEIGEITERRFECKEIPRDALAGVANSFDVIRRARGLT